MPEFRSRGVIECPIGTKIQREHVYQRKKIVADILNGADLDSVLEHVIHCVVRKEEHTKLKSVSQVEDGWVRYRSASTDVFRCRDVVPEKYEPWQVGEKVDNT
jgi:hypothetical protein